MAYVSTTIYGMSGSSNTGSPLSTVAYTEPGRAVTNPGTKSNTEGGSLSVSTRAGLRFDLRQHPLLRRHRLAAGLWRSTSTGAIRGTVGTYAAANGPYTTTVIASDGAYSGQDNLAWNIASPITLTNPGTQNSAEGGLVSMTLSGTDLDQWFHPHLLRLRTADGPKDFVRGC